MSGHVLSEAGDESEAVPACGVESGCIIHYRLPRLVIPVVLRRTRL